MKTTKACKVHVAQWKPVNFGKYGSVYEVSNTGQVRRIGTQKPLRSWKAGKGYSQVELWCEGKRKLAYVHRLVALTFIPNPDGKPYVNHKYGHKPSNHVADLEWSTMDENNEHAIETGLNYTGTKRGPYNTGAHSPVCKARKR